jgi:hypothetical protein
VRRGTVVRRKMRGNDEDPIHLSRAPWCSGRAAPRVQRFPFAVGGSSTYASSRSRVDILGSLMRLSTSGKSRETMKTRLIQRCLGYGVHRLSVSIAPAIQSLSGSRSPPRRTKTTSIIRRRLS